MTPVPRSKKKDMETPNSRAQGNSASGVKRSAEEGEKEKTEESNMEKRGKPAEKETLGLLEKVEEENEQKEEETEKEMDEGQEESSDSSHSETAFMDLPDDAHRHILSFLDLPTSLNLRVNKRLNRLQLSVKHKIKKITIKLESSQSQLIMGNHCSILALSSNSTHWEKGLRRLAVNTIVDMIEIITDCDPSEQQTLIIEALFHFKANKLIMKSSRMTLVCHFSRLTLPSLLTLAQNVRNVELGRECTSLSTKDLCTIRKIMLENGCTMQSFFMGLWLEGEQKKKAFVEECFGVTASKYLGPLCGMMYQTTDDSLEMFQKYACWWNSDVDHFEGDLRTWTDYHGISFKKLDVVVKPHDSFKIKWSHLYRDI